MDEPGPSLSLCLMLKRQSYFSEGVWGMRCALRGVVNQAFLKSLWRRGASGSPHRITGTWTRQLSPPLYCKKYQCETFAGKKKDLYHITFSTFENLLQMDHLLNHKLSAIGSFLTEKTAGTEKASVEVTFFTVYTPLCMDTSRQHYLTLSTLKR